MPTSSPDVSRTDVRVTGELQYAAARARTVPPVERVRDGLWCLPVPLPIASVGYVLVYALELADGVALIDSGWRDERSYQALVEGLGVAGFGIGDVRAVLGTHVHLDHYGLAARLRAESGAWVGLHSADAAAIVDPGDSAALARTEEAAARLRAEVGTPERASASPMRSLLPQGHPDRVINDGDVVELGGWDLRAVWTPGHTPGHLCFYERRLGLLFSGDHVLPGITPGVGVTTYQRPDPIADQLASLRAVGGLEVSEVLPAHQYRFAGLRERTAELTAHVESRLAEVVVVLPSAPGATCWAVARALSWARPFETLSAFQVRSAVGETHACLIRLANAGQVRFSGGSPRRWFVG
jgi:glyoxylase-like metal-dependent hydrolase (beta-lactamase superfamily II)